MLKKNVKNIRNIGILLTLHHQEEEQRENTNEAEIFYIHFSVNKFINKAHQNPNK